MKAGKAVLLFIIGVLLVLLALPVAWGFSVLSGYILMIIAIIVGAYLIARRGTSKLPLILGVVLLVIAIPVLLGTLAVHVSLWAILRGMEEATKVTTINSSIGRSIKAGEWLITVLDVKEATYIRKDDSYYKANLN